MGEFGFELTRFGVRVTAVLVSPWIPAGTVYRAPAGGPPLDHTSILKAMERRWGLAALTRRVAAAPDFGSVLSLATPRTDDPIQGVQVPCSSGAKPAAGTPAHLQQIQAELVARLPVPDATLGSNAPMSDLESSADQARYIETRTDAWKASRGKS